MIGIMAKIDDSRFDASGPALFDSRQALQASSCSPVGSATGDGDGEAAAPPVRGALEASTVMLETRSHRPGLPVFSTDRGGAGCEAREAVISPREPPGPSSGRGCRQKNRMSVFSG